MIRSLVSVELAREADVVHARQRARQVAALLGFDATDQVRIATAVSEIARNAHSYGGGGRVEFAVETGREAFLRVRVVDRGPGLAHLEEVLSGTYRSKTGMGLGIVGAKRLMDAFDVQTAPGQGTTVTLSKRLPPESPVLQSGGMADLGGELSRDAALDPMQTLVQQNRELLQALDALRSREAELETLNAELEETNRGVVALYAELDQRAEYLKRASDLKSRFLSNMSHEFRTPLGSILSLAGMLLDRLDGDLSSEQEVQVRLIRRSAEDLSQLVNDLLDLAKVEAGKLEVRPSEFRLSELFNTLRAMLRPLATNPNVTLVFDESGGAGSLFTDESKLAQILRNFISNALKFTERGEVRVSARVDGDEVSLAVRDTGIGISPEDQARIFEEFTQVEGPLQRRVKGTGLGLPLTQKLAELLGGRVTLQSEPGHGSTFAVVLPRRFQPAAPEAPQPASTESARLDGGAPLPRVLVIDDEEASRYVVRQSLRERFQVSEATTGHEGLQRARELQPAAVILDLRLPDMGGEQVLDALQADAATRGIPVVVFSSQELDAAARARLRAAVAVVSKHPGKAEAVREALLDALRRAGVARLDHGAAAP